MRRNIKVSLLALLLALTLTVSFVSFASSGEKSLVAKYMDITILLNGEEVVPVNANGDAVEPFTVDGTTYVPLRAIAGMFGYEVDWDADTSSVLIDTPAVAAPLSLLDIARVGDDDFDGFIAGLEFISGADLSAVEDGDYEGAMMAAVGLAELANAYAARGVENAALVVANDIGLLNGEFAATANGLNDILYNTAAYLGTSRGYVGSLSDADIATKLANVWNSIPAIENEDLGAIGTEVFYEGLLTGFNIRNSAYSVDFDAERTMIYSHSNLTHVQQLVLLLKNCGIDARVALEPKMSWYIWEGYVGFDPEYDVRFEFADAEDMLVFDGYIKEYAQKITGDETDLLKSSWETPLYAASVELDEAYTELVCNTVHFDNGYYIVSYGPVGEISDMVCDMFDELGGSSVQSAIFTNNDFLDYVVTELSVAE